MNNSEYGFLPTYKNGNMLKGADFQSYINVLKYIDFNRLEISDEQYSHGFNENSGNVYITTTDDVCVCSCFGGDVLFIYSEGIYGIVAEFDEYTNAMEYIKEYNKLRESTDDTMKEDDIVALIKKHNGERI